MYDTNGTANDDSRRGMWRSRWAAIGAAVAVSLGAGGLFVAQATPGPAESTVVPPPFHPYTAGIANDITYDAYGQAGQTTDILVDVVGYLTNTGLQQLVADVETLKSRTPIVRSTSTEDVSPDPTTDAIILSVTIEAPVPGVIQAVGSVWFSSGPAGSYECHLTDADRVITTSDPFQDSDRRLEKGAAGDTTCTTNGAAAVPAGTYKINLAVDVPGAGANVDDASLDVVFFPGSGTVTSSLSAPFVDTDN